MAAPTAGSTGNTGAAVAQAAGPLFGTALGMGFTNYSLNKQYHAQKRLTAMQMEAQKEIGRFNTEQAMDIWEKTGYGATRRQMENAGLNVGLMYGMGGSAGGTTSGGQAQGVSGGSAQAPEAPIMGIQMGLTAAMQQAQIELLKAQTKKTNVEAGNIGEGGIDTASKETAIANLKQQTENAQVQKAILEYDKTIREVEANVAGRTREEQVAMIEEALRKLKGEATSAQVKGAIDIDTKDDVIKNAELVNKATEAGIAGTEAGTSLTKQKTEESKQTVANLKLDEKLKALDVQMKEDGVTSADPAIVRIAQRWLRENDISMSKLTEKMKRLTLWLKGEAGSQTWEHLQEIMNQ